MSGNALVPIVFGIIGLAAAWYIYQQVKKFPAGEAKVVEIAEAIHRGAMVFMRREYKMLALFCVVLIVVLWFTLGIGTAFAFLVGALCSAGAGYIGMSTATRANVRTTTAAHTRGAADALTVAFFGGSIMGLAVASLGLFGLGVLYLLFGGRSGDRAHHSWLRDGRIQRGAVLPGRRRHLHQERGHRSGSRRQARGGHPRGRSAQPRGYRGQRRRQRR